MVIALSWNTKNGNGGTEMKENAPAWFKTMLHKQMVEIKMMEEEFGNDIRLLMQGFKKKEDIKKKEDKEKKSDNKKHDVKKRVEKKKDAGKKLSKETEKYLEDMKVDTGKKKKTDGKEKITYDKKTAGKILTNHQRTKEQQNNKTNSHKIERRRREQLRDRNRRYIQ